MPVFFLLAFALSFFECLTLWVIFKGVSLTSNLCLGQKKNPSESLSFTKAFNSFSIILIIDIFGFILAISYIYTCKKFFSPSPASS